MGQCIYCGQNAGLLKNAHEACRATHEEGKAKMVGQAATMASHGLVANWGSQETPIDLLEQALTEIADKSYVSREYVRQALAIGWEQALERSLEDGLLTAKEEQNLVRFAKRYALDTQELAAGGSWSRIVKAATLRDVMEGKVPARVQWPSQVPFILQKSEQLVWLFFNVPLLEEKVVKTYVGGQRGASIRIAKGMYYRTSGFRGRTIETSQVLEVDRGTLGIATKHVYFGGPKKSFRIPYDKIVGLTPYTDGIGITKDAARAKPQVFRLGDGWFAYNLLSNLAQNQQA